MLSYFTLQFHTYISITYREGTCWSVQTEESEEQAHLILLNNLFVM